MEVHPLSLSGNACAMLLAMGVPALVLQACHYVATIAHTKENPCIRDVTVLECFSGCARISEEFRSQLSICVTTYDKQNDSTFQDLTTVAGFLSLLKKALRLKEGALLWFANPCHMFVWMSSSIHKRRPENPWGDASQPSVCMSNCITSRACLVLFIITCRGVWSAIEQPASSTLKWVPYFLHLRKLLMECNGELWKQCSFWMGLYGHDNAKPSYCIGSSRWIMKLKNQMTRNKRRDFSAAAKKVVVRKKRADGTTTVTGTKKLTKTQEYPRAFAKAVATLHLEDTENVSHPPGLTLQGILNARLDCPGDWSEAKLTELREFLVAEANSGAWEPLQGMPF
ncbi:unnamed protein product [Symbiodinium necroappetens]|uniref:Uncharacterized protein n=1 Tax=Symbiodinium necroappetens TaxID=1628268 RepID=A0A812WG71_9DINO|nr:unnamed protein product [Symbiodinium necroappetens]